jgi:excisionase family DNA binding protein
MSENREPERLVTTVSAACYTLEIGKDRLYELLNTGEIESYLDGRARRIVVASLKGYVAKRVRASKQFERARYPRRVKTA